MNENSTTAASAVNRMSERNCEGHFFATLRYFSSLSYHTTVCLSVVTSRKAPQLYNVEVLEKYFSCVVVQIKLLDSIFFLLAVLNDHYRNGILSISHKIHKNDASMSTYITSHDEDELICLVGENF